MSLYENLQSAIERHSSLEKSDMIDAGNYGADQGFSGFTYNDECIEFYEKNVDLITELLCEVAEIHGYKNNSELISTFNRQDMLNDENSRKVLLAWFVLEEVGRHLECH